MLSLLLGVALGGVGYSQSVYAPLDKDYYHLVERYEIRSGRAANDSLAEAFHSSVRPYERRGIALLADSLLLDSAHYRWNARDRFNLQFLQADNHEWSMASPIESRRALAKVFYRTPADFYHYRNASVDLHVNPVFYGQLGQASDTDPTLYINTRGLEVRGMIDGKVGFYTFMAENQAELPGYVNDRMRATNVLPHEGFWKRFNDTGVDFVTARGYITFPVTRHIHVQAGHDRLFIGNGYRSMILSDFANNYSFLKLNTRVWRFEYTNLFAKMKADLILDPSGNGTPQGSYGVFPSKYLAFHHLSVNLLKNLNVGIFESIVFERNDSTGRNGFELQYLNPIIFYRALDQDLGSPDNVLLGLDARWVLWRRLSLYGQLALDEFILSHTFDGSGWWGNKQAGQLGFKYIDVAGIPNLDLQAEFNVARPYMYGHSSLYTSYTHYKQPLAHPLGANFREGIGILRYQPLPRLALTGKLIYALYGTDLPNSNWGGNILIDYNYKRQEFGNYIGQGVKTYLLFADFTATYQLRHRLFLDAKFTHRQLDSADDALDQTTTVFSAAVRWNIPQRLHEF